MSQITEPGLGDVQHRLLGVRDQMGKVVLGQEHMIEQMMIALLCGGHALLEGVPGTAKTLAVRALARALSCGWKRIQFTPDLMPSDIVGTNVFDMSNNSFSLRRGPIFTDLLLADEINRAPAKTQSALLEGMSERHATIDGSRHMLSEVFTVFATQNPIEFEGTYPLPEAQQDRFLIKIKVGYPHEQAELNILEAYDSGKPLDHPESGQLQPVIDIAQLVSARAALANVRVEPGVLRYILTIARETRNHDSVLVGASPRGSISLLLASKGRTLLQGRDFVTPDDVVAMVDPVLGHRITLAADAEISGSTTAEVLQSILDKTEVPR